MSLKLIAMRGYPGSGKTHTARELVLASKGDLVRVSRDDLRLALHNRWWTGDPRCEDQVTIAEEAQVVEFLKAGVSVVVDACHLREAYLTKWARIAREFGAEFDIINELTPVGQCVARDQIRQSRGERYVGAKVIEKMARQFPQSQWKPVNAGEPFTPEPVVFDPRLKNAIIVDIDGTLAHMNDKRGPFEFDKVHVDDVDESVSWVIRNLAVSKQDDHWPYVIIMSGRDDTCKKETADWLAEHKIGYDYLLMRPAEAKDERGNKLPDYQVKYDLFNAHVRGKFNVRAVFDDRDQVVKLWRDMGLKCMQVQKGDF